jgi:Tfp pilus assembly protein FimT
VIELLIVVVVGGIITAIAIPVLNTAMNNMRMNSVVSGISAALSKTRYRAVMTNQVYTLVLTTATDTFVVTNTGTGVADAKAPLPSTLVVLTGATAGTFTYTFCPNGMVYGAAAVCTITNNVANNAAPTITATYQGRQMTVNVSSVGNVTNTTIY